METPAIQTQFAETLALWRAELGWRLETAAALIGALLLAETVADGWRGRVRHAAVDLLTLARRVRLPMVRHPAPWLDELRHQLAGPRRALRAALRDRAVTTGAAVLDVTQVLEDLDEADLAASVLVAQLGSAHAAAGGLA